MRYLILILLVLSVPALAAWTEYKNTNQLVMDKTFKTDLTRFFADAKGDYITPSDNVAKQAILALSGPADDLKKLPDGSTIAAACRPHSCDEKGAVLLKDNAIIAAALINFHCTGKPTKCDDNPTLTIFQKKGPDNAAAFVAWAEGKQEETAALVATEATKLPPLKTEFVTLP